VQARPILIRATEGGNYDELIDPRLEGKFDRQQMLCMVICAAASIRHSSKRRPKMSQVIFFFLLLQYYFLCSNHRRKDWLIDILVYNLQIVRTLEGDVALLNDLYKGSTPGISGSGESSECDGAGSSYGNIKRLKNSEISSEEYTSSQHGSPGEFVQSKAQS